MGWLVLLVLGGVAAYVMKPHERRDVARKALRPVEDLWFAYQDDRAKPDEFRDALRARTRWPLATWALVAATVFVQRGVFALLVDVAGLVQPAVLIERLLGHTALLVVFLSGASVGTAIDFSRHPLTLVIDTTGGVLATYGVLLALLVRGLLRRSVATIPLRTLRRLAPAAAIFVLHALWTGALVQASGAVPLALGFVFGMVLARDVAERTARIDRSVAVAIASLVIAAGIALPFRGIVDARPEVTRVLAVEDRTANDYASTVRQFKLGALKGEAVAQMIERRIEPELDQIDARLAALGRVPADQQALVAAAGEYVALRRESWQLRAKGFHKSNMRLLRDADEKERASLAALDRLRPPE
jgi:hypothetical protein